MSSETSQKTRKNAKFHLLIMKYRGRIALTVLICLLGSIYGWFRLYEIHTYIQCNDPSINKPYFSDTVSVQMLFIFLLLIPLVKMAVIEWLMHPDRTSKGSLRHSLATAFSHFYNILICAMLSFCIVEFLKCSVGEARPNFMSLCDPVLPENCTSSMWVRLTYEDCRNPMNIKERAVKDSMKSFPSGHAFLGVFASVFMVIYLQKRLKITWSRILLPLLQILWVGWGVLSSVSRIWDHKHHWNDVVAGTIMGGSVGYFCAVHMCNGFVVATTELPIQEKPLEGVAVKDPAARERKNLVS